MVDWFHSRLESILDGIIVAIVFGVGVAMWSLIHKLPPPIIFVAGIATLAAILVIWNQIALWRERTRRRLTKLSDKELENTIREWVDIPDLTFKRSDMPNAYFMFTLTDKFNQQIHVMRHKEEPQYITIWTDIDISSHPTPDIQLSEEDLEKIGVNINLEMARLGIYFATTGTGTKSIHVRLYNPVFLGDSLTSFDFKRECLFVIRALVLLKQVLRKTLNELGISLPTSDKESPQKGA